MKPAKKIKKTMADFLVMACMWNDKEEVECEPLSFSYAGDFDWMLKEIRAGLFTMKTNDCIKLEEEVARKLWSHEKIGLINNIYGDPPFLVFQRNREGKMVAYFKMGCDCDRSCELSDDMVNNGFFIKTCKPLKSTPCSTNITLEARQIKVIRMKRIGDLEESLDNDAYHFAEEYAQEQMEIVIKMPEGRKNSGG